MTRDLRTLIYLLNLELREECSRTLGPGMQSGSSSRSGRNRATSSSKRTQSGSSSRIGEADAIGPRAAAWSGRNRGAAAGREAEANGEREQQWKRMPQSGPGAAAEGGEQQLKRTQSGRSSSSESCPAPDYAR